MTASTLGSVRRPDGVYEYVYVAAKGHRGAVARGRRYGSGTRETRIRRRGDASRQEAAVVHAVDAKRRLRDRDQRVEGEDHRRYAREAVLPALHVSRRSEVYFAREV